MDYNVENVQNGRSSLSNSFLCRDKCGVFEKKKTQNDIEIHKIPETS